jgi:hypothetical protein
LALYPVHEEGDVVGGRQVRRLLVLPCVLSGETTILSNYTKCSVLNPVFRVRDILVRNRMRVWILGVRSVHLTNGSGYGSGSCSFRQWPLRCQQKILFFL